MTLNRVNPNAGWTDGTRQPACRWCKGPLPAGRRSFCGGVKTRHVLTGKFPPARVLVLGSGCIHEWLVRSQPGYARLCVEARDKGICAACGGKGEWQADHIIPVVEGGGECGLENLRTLCVGCHKKETRALAARRAEARRCV